MNKLYLTFSEKRKYFAFDEAKKTYQELDPSDIEALLIFFQFHSVSTIIESDHMIEVLFENGDSILIDTAHVFMPSDSYDSYIGVIYQKIKEKIESINMNAYQSELPHDYRNLKVNRSRNKQFAAKGKAFVIGVGLSVSILLAAVFVDMNFDFKKKDSLSVTPNIQEEYVINLEKQLGVMPNIEDAIVRFSLNDFSYSQKLKETKDYFGNLIQYYSTRYGLPYELNCAQITLERPNIVNGKCENICQISSAHIGESFHVPVYDANGFTGTYDDFVITQELLDNPEGNIKAGLAYNRYCVDLYDNLLLGYFLYNQGHNALANACNHTGANIDYFKLPENILAARDFIVNYYKEIKPEEVYGDPTYLEDVLSFLSLQDRGGVLEYYSGDQIKRVLIGNANKIDKEESIDYNSGLTKG